MDINNALLIIKALDGLSTRATVTAQNIANAGTPSYRPLRVSFEKSLADAAARGAEAVREVQPQIEHASPGATGDDLRLDLELATSSITALRYGALIDVLSRELQLESLSITGNT